MKVTETKVFVFNFTVPARNDKEQTFLLSLKMEAETQKQAKDQLQHCLKTILGELAE